jgi:hypothetical protein
MYVYILNMKSFRNFEKTRKNIIIKLLKINM